MSTTAEQPKPELTAKARRFRALLKEKKRGGVVVQLKYGPHILIEGPPERAAEFTRVANQWNAEGRRMHTRSEFFALAQEALEKFPDRQDELNFGGPTLPAA